METMTTNTPQPESKTPRVDAMVKLLHGSDSQPFLDFARTLETENITLRNAQKACEFCDESYIEQLRQQLTTALKERDEAITAFPDTYYADRSIAERIEFMSAGWAKAIECLDNQTEYLDKLAIDRDNWKQMAMLLFQNASCVCTQGARCGVCEARQLRNRLEQTKKGS